MIGRAINMRRLAREQEGATLTEFGLVAPILIMMLMGIFDMAHSQYTSAMVNGAMQKAARDLTLENAASQQSNHDARVIAQIRTVVPKNADIELKKLSHFDFSDVGAPEEWSDDNGNGVCDGGEVYIDANKNGRWDANRGVDGIGGARDVVLYTAIVRYDRLFPIYNMIGIDQQASIQASTVLRNQPFDEQDRSVLTGTCS